MRYWMIGEFDDELVHEWFPTFNSTLLELLRDTLPGIQRTKPSKVHGSVRYHSIPDLPFEPVVTSNSNWIFDLESKKAIGFSTHDNVIEVVTQGKDILEYFDSTTLHVGNYFEEQNKVLNAAYKYCREKLEIKPWRYSTHKWYPPQLNYTPMEDRLYFRGFYIDVPRTFLKYLKTQKLESIDIDFQEKLRPHDYYVQCAISKACVAAPGAQDFCNRDIELFSMGIPVIRPRFFCNMDIEIPDDVYIPIDFTFMKHPDIDISLHGYPNDSEKLATDVITVWDEVRRDQNLLNKISKNAKEFYSEFFTNDKMLHYTLNLINTELT